MLCNAKKNEFLRIFLHLEILSHKQYLHQFQKKGSTIFYGIKPVLVDKDGREIKGAGEGRLCIAQSWPGQMRTVYGRSFTKAFAKVEGAILCF